MKMFSNLGVHLALILFCGLFALQVEALKCFRCESSPSGHCSNKCFNRTGIDDDCVSGVTACLVERIKSSSTGKNMWRRDCAPRGQEEETGCHNRIGSQESDPEFKVDCFCKEDLCNDDKLYAQPEAEQEKTCGSGSSPANPEGSSTAAPNGSSAMAAAAGQWKATVGVLGVAILFFTLY